MSKVTVGLDIGFDTLKLAGLERQGQGFRLVGFNSAKIPPGSWQADQLGNLPELAKVIEVTMRTAKPHGINTKHAVIAMPESVIFSGAFTMPIMAEKELRKAIPFEAAEKLSINLEEYQLDFETSSIACQLSHTLRAPTESNNAKEPAKEKPLTIDKPAVLVFAVAAKRTLINSVVDLCKEAHLEPKGLDIKPGGIVRAMAPVNDHKARLVVDLGASAIGTFVVEGQALRLISTVPIGFRQIQGDQMLDAVPAGAAEKLSPIFDEIVHLTKFFENRVCAGTKIAEIILSGGGSNLPGIEKLFQQETGFKTSLGNPLERVDTHHFPIPPNIARTFADAIGLAMYDD